MALGVAKRRSFDFTEVEVEEIATDIRRHDLERLAAQGGLFAGKDRLHTGPRPEPLVATRINYSAT